MSAKVSRLAGSPLVAAAIASSSCARPASTSPAETRANPSWASARSSKSGSPAASAALSAPPRTSQPPTTRASLPNARGQANPARRRERHLEQALRSRQPATSRSVVAEHQRVLSREPQGNPSGTAEVPAPEPRVCSLPTDDCFTPFVKPPERTAKSVKRFGRFLGANCLFESAARVRPVADSERSITAGEHRVRRHGRHSLMVAREHIKGEGTPPGMVVRDRRRSSCCHRSYPAATTSDNIRRGTGFAVCHSCLRRAGPCQLNGAFPPTAGH